MKINHLLSYSNTYKTPILFHLLNLSIVEFCKMVIFDHPQSYNNGWVYLDNNLCLSATILKGGKQQTALFTARCLHIRCNATHRCYKEKLVNTWIKKSGHLGLPVYVHSIYMDNMYILHINICYLIYFCNTSDVDFYKLYLNLDSLQEWTNRKRQ